MQVKKVSSLPILALALLAPLAAGCPDYSHQRPVPDYENMVDGGGEEGEVSPEERE